MNITNPTHLRSFKGRLKTSSTSFTPKLQSGMTLIEVLIAMFVLAIGVLALLAVQLRTVSNVRESENQTTVAQITQNLIEGMLINPKLSPETDPAGEKTTRYKKSYDDYIEEFDSTQTAKFEAKMNKTQLAQAQIAQFKADLAEALPEARFYFTICKDSSGAEPTYYNDDFQKNCDDKGNTTIVKVLWLQDVEEENASKNLNTSGHHVVYTYQSRVRD